MTGRRFVTDGRMLWNAHGTSWLVEGVLETGFVTRRVLGTDSLRIYAATTETISRDDVTDRSGFISRLEAMSGGFPPLSPADADAAEEWSIDARMAEAYA